MKPWMRLPRFRCSCIRCYEACLSRYCSASLRWYCAHPSVAEQRLLTVAIVGAPNAGKSTLVNSLVGSRVSAVTPVAHTTRTRANGILNIGNTQLVFMDTPGIVSHEEGRRLNMNNLQVRAPRRTCGAADMLAIIVDVANRRTRDFVDENILEVLETHRDVHSILVMNKVDLVRHKVSLLNFASMLTLDREKDQWGYKPYGGWSKFKEVFMVSSHTKDGLEDMVKYFVANAKESPWLYSESVHTDSSLEQQIAEVFREKLLILFQHEIPWQLKQETVLMELLDSGLLRIHQKLTWPKKSQRRYVLSRIDELTTEVVDELKRMLSCSVSLTIDISHKKNATVDDLPFY